MYFKPERLKELRDSRGITLDQMAAITNVSKQVLSTWETGACEPRISTLNKVSEAMAVPFDFFFSQNETTVMSSTKVQEN